MSRSVEPLLDEKRGGEERRVAMDKEREREKEREKG